MKKEEILDILKVRNIQSYYLINESLLVVICQDITWKEIKVISEYIVDIQGWNDDYIRISIDID